MNGGYVDFNREQIDSLLRDILLGGENAAVAAQQLSQPLRTALLYDAIARHMLVTEPVNMGDLYRLEKDVDVPAFYFSEVMPSIPETVVEGETFIVRPFEIATVVSTPMQEIMLRPYNVVDNMLLKAKNSILIEEDRRFFRLLDAVVPNGPEPFNHVLLLSFAAGTTVEEMVDQFRYSVNFLAAKIEEKNLRAQKIIMNPVDYRRLVASARADQVDFITAREHMIAAHRANFMGLEVWETALCPRGKVYILTEPEYLGRMPIWQDVTIMPDPSGVTRSLVRFVVQEFLNMIIHNPKGVARIDITYAV